ncbi:hypothetical protein [Caballeronia sp. GAFFF1]|uniref:hypothetical protein n=1 Tax=Caballeronia sp. GAFFF1 TaxID=2921779 RepID=UPI0020277CB2|nr:hypothetical protein [Caballeronia sp. GAFFF1]
MKNFLDSAKFGEQLRRALEAKRDEIETLPRFKEKRFRTDSGADFLLFWNHRYPHSTMAENTARNWVLGRRFPLKSNWPLLTHLVGKTEAWLRGWEDDEAASRSSVEAAEVLPPYAEEDKPRRRRELIDEIGDKLQQLRSLE